MIICQLNSCFMKRTCTKHWQKNYYKKFFKLIEKYMLYSSFGFLLHQMWHWEWSYKLTVHIWDFFFRHYKFVWFFGNAKIQLCIKCIHIFFEFQFTIKIIGQVQVLVAHKGFHTINLFITNCNLTKIVTEKLITHCLR